MKKKEEKKQPSNTPIPPWQVRHRSVQHQERWIGVHAEANLLSTRLINLPLASVVRWEPAYAYSGC